MYLFTLLKGLIKMRKKTILIADDVPIILQVLEQKFTYAKYKVDTAMDGEAALSKLKDNYYDIALLDLRMPKKDGISILKEIKKLKIDTTVIIMTAFGTIRDAVDAIKIGAYDYITKPFDNDEIISRVQQAIKYTKKFKSFNISSVEESVAVTGSSKEIVRMKAKIEKIRNLDSTVLVIGESGTGKNVVAKEIHNTSKRRKMPFIHLNCAVLPPTLIESELFGHEKGAFTGAVDLKKGKFELAGEGTIFLDEIATLSLSLQAKLLNVLQERKFERVGGIKSIPMNARIIAATNTNLEEAIRRKEFREDLYYRLNVITIECPPLRYRKKDIKELVLNFINKFNNKLNKSITEISPDVWPILKNYDWPGNIRELENAIESAVAFATGETLSGEDLPPRIRFKHQLDVKQGVLENQEIEIIKNVLEKFNGHRENVAKELGISRRTLQYKLNKFGLRTK